MRTGLQSHVHSRPSRVLPALPAIGKSRPLSMQPAQLSVKPLADDIPISHNNSSDKRIRTHLAPPVLGKLKRMAHMCSFRACELRVHRTD
jgi:hypothetical protein